MTILTSNHNRLMPVLRITAALSISVGLLGAAGLTITSPANGTVASPGQSLPVTVAANGSFTQIVIAGQNPIGFSQVLTGSGTQFSLPIPPKTPPGLYSLTALGVSGGSSVSSTPIIISVERPDAPVEVHVTPETLNLPAGERMALRVVGTYADGTKLDITHSASTTFASTSPNVASVDNQGNVTAASSGSTRILVSNNLSMTVQVTPGLSIAPAWPFLYGNQSMQFSAFQPGMAPVSAKWSISPQLGSISASGVYTAPRQIAQWESVNITATLKTGQSISTGVTLLPPMTIGLLPAGPVTLPAGFTERFGANVQNTVDNGVVWSLKGPGTIDQTGLYTAPATVSAQQSTAVVTVTSIPYPAISASATINLLH